jgi:transcriptional regulator with XRE-family HTH domain
LTVFTAGRSLKRLFGSRWGRRLRELRGFDTHQADFTKELGISQAQLSRYEKGKSEMGAKVVLRIGRKFGKSMEWVLTGKD